MPRSSILRLLKDTAEIFGPATLGNPDPITFDQTAVDGPSLWTGKAAVQDDYTRRRNDDGSDTQILDELTVRVPAEGFASEVVPGCLVQMTSGPLNGERFQVVRVQTRTNQTVIGLEVKRWSSLDLVESRP